MEIKLNLPKAFTGKQTKLNKFIQDVTLHLAINQEVYNNDEKKIASSFHTWLLYTIFTKFCFHAFITFLF